MIINDSYAPTRFIVRGIIGVVVGVSLGFFLHRSASISKQGSKTLLNSAIYFHHHIPTTVHTFNNSIKEIARLKMRNNGAEHH